jgi:hypothetical protein
MESENNRNEEILENSQEGSQEGGQENNGAVAYNNIDGGNTFILRNTTALPATKLSLAAVQTAVTRFNNTFYSKSIETLTVGGETLNNRPLFLKDLLDLLNPTSDLSKVFNAIPIAQFKHLPDPTVLNTPAASGGQYDLSTNSLNEQSLETPEETPEVMPSLEVEEPLTSGGARRHKWFSHKKRRHTRIRTKKNKKL